MSSLAIKNNYFEYLYNSLNGKELGRVALMAKEEIKQAKYVDYLNQLLNLLT